MIGERLCFALVYLAESLIVWLYFERVFMRKKNLPAVLTIFIACFAVLFFISSLDSIILNTVAFFLGIGIVMLVCYYASIKAAVLHCALITFVMCFSEIVVALLLTVFVDDYTAYTYNLIVMVALAVCSKLLFFLISFIMSQMSKPDYDRSGKNEDSKATLLLSAMPVSSTVIALTIIYVGMTVPLVSLTEILMAASVVLLLFLNIVVLAIYYRTQKVYKENLELNIINMRGHFDADYYQMLREQYERQRVLIHDIKNHCYAINALAAEGKTQEISDYIRKIEELPELRGKVRACDDSILNMILVRYAEYCDSAKISFEYDVRANSVSFMDAPSIASLFGNLISNAVEAAENSSEKRIELSVMSYYEPSRTVISIVNSCDCLPKTDKRGRLISTKDDKGTHGFGTKSIDRIIKEYDGTSKFYYDENERVFHYIAQFIY